MCPEAITVTEHEFLRDQTVVEHRGPVNENHLRMLSSPRWAEILRTHVLPWLESVGELGDDVP